MNDVWNTAKRYAPWLLLLGGVDGFFVLLLWLSDAQALLSLSGVIALASLVLFLAIVMGISRKEKRKQILFQAFLSSPDEVNTEKLLDAVSEQEKKQLVLLADVLDRQQSQLQALQDALHDYEEYVEGWAHEAKTPLSLLTILLDNRADELPPDLQMKLDYVRSQLQEDITQMLYYARLGSSTKDYRMEPIKLREALDEVLEDYAPLLEEKKFQIKNSLQEETVYTDHRGLVFMLGQIISNAIRYSQKDPALTISLWQEAGSDVLTIADSGIGVKSYDLPYIFQKGFTGDSLDSQKKATGMGLYLTKKMADDLGLQLEAESEWGRGFALSIYFPKVQ